MNPDSIHVQWTPSDPVASRLASYHRPSVVISSLVSPEKRLCGLLHDCVPSILPSDSAMLTASACALLSLDAHEDVQLSVVELHRASVSKNAKHPGIQSANDVALSIDLAGALAVHPGDEIYACPTSYTSGRTNQRLRVVAVEAIDRRIGADIVVSHEAVQSLGIGRQSAIYVYALDNADTLTAQVKVLKHPGFLYAPLDESKRDWPSVGTVVNLRHGKIVGPYCQAHAPLDSTDNKPNFFQLDAGLADALGLSAADKLDVTPIEAQLWWSMKQPVDDIRNKARMGIALEQAAFQAAGYRARENVHVFIGSGSFQATVEVSAAVKSPSMVGVTPLLSRAAHIKAGTGLFVSTEHEQYTVARTGIFNVEDVGTLDVKGSSQLAAMFPMPCRVVLVNPRAGASMDVTMEADQFPRSVPMVRMSRTTRQMLLLERGDDVVVLPVKAVPRRRSFRSTITAFVWAIQERALSALIGRRRILMSVAPGHTWDDQARVARVDPEALSVLGIADGDRIRVRYRGSVISRLTLVRDASAPPPIHIDGAEDAPYNVIPVQFQLGLDALGRYELAEGAIDFGTVVEVERDMGHILRKSLNLTIIPIVGTVVTVVTLFAGRPPIVQIGVAATLGLLFFYLALSVERAKVR